MIRGNWSLANDLRNEQAKQQLKVQQRQKNKQKHEKLEKIDPRDLYNKIKRLKLQENNDSKYLKTLEEDWLFIKKNGLHSAILQQIEEDEERIRLQESTLRGSKSIYFNPELNPLGKVPKNLINPSKPFRNDLISHHSYNYPKDPIIDSLDIQFPSGEPPKFYKQVQNVEKNTILLESKESTVKVNSFIPSNILKRKRPKEKVLLEALLNPVDSLDEEVNLSVNDEGREGKGALNRDDLNDDSLDENLLTNSLAEEEEEYQLKRAKLENQDEE